MTDIIRDFMTYLIAIDPNEFRKSAHLDTNKKPILYRVGHPVEFSNEQLVNDLKAFAFNRTIEEETLIKSAKRMGIDLGRNPKTRLNYLISLKTIPTSEPLYYGKGKGGTRLFHPDTLEILLELKLLKEDDTLAEKAKQINEARADRIMTVFKKYDYVGPTKPEAYESIRDLFAITAFDSRLFDLDRIRAAIISTKILLLTDYTGALGVEIGYLKRFADTVSLLFCEKCLGHISAIIKSKTNQDKYLHHVLSEAYSEAKEILHTKEKV